jgi:hypothetical protein
MFTQLYDFVLLVILMTIDEKDSKLMWTMVVDPSTVFFEIF